MRFISKEILGTRYRSYNCMADVKRAIKMLVKRGFNYFVRYHDSKGGIWSLNFTVAEWCSKQSPNYYYVNW